MLKLRVLDLSFHWNKCFCYYTESKVPKKGTVGYRYRISGIDTGTVLVQMWTVPNPTLLIINEIHNTSLRFPQYVCLNRGQVLDLCPGVCVVAYARSRLGDLHCWFVSVASIWKQPYLVKATWSVIPVAREIFGGQFYCLSL